MTDALVFALIGAVVLGTAAYVLRQRGTFAKDAPTTRHLGPIVKGRSRTKGTKLEGDGFAYPLKGGHVNALVEPCGPLTGEKRIVFRWENTGPGATFHAQEAPTERGEISLMLQHRDCDYMGTREQLMLRLYAPGQQFMELGEGRMMVNLTPAGWIGVAGDEEPTQAQFDEMLANVAAIQVCFGGGGSRAHGVFASGPARFALLSLTAS